MEVVAIIITPERTCVRRKAKASPSRFSSMVAPVVLVGVKTVAAVEDARAATRTMSQTPASTPAQASLAFLKAAKIGAVVVVVVLLLGITARPQAL
jgi:hypothetical protein